MSVRRITIHGRTFTWKPGRRYVPIKSPEGKTTLVKKTDLLGISPDTLERASRKRYTIPIYPRDVARWILRNKL